MKRNALIILAAFVISFFAMVPTRAGVTTFYGNLANEPALTYNKNYVFDLDNRSVDKLSAQANISSATIPSQTFTDGTKSTGSITVSSWTALSETRAVGSIRVTSNSALSGNFASDSITISSNGILSGTSSFDLITVSSFAGLSSFSTITLNGTQYIANQTWALGTDSATTAVNISTYFNTGNFGVAASTVAPGVVKFYALHIGSSPYNSYSLASATQAALAVLTSSFTGGSDPAYFTFNGRVFTANKQWAVGGSSITTAINIAGIMGGQAYGLTASTSADAVVLLKMSVVGAVYNLYTLTSSSPAALAVESSSFTRGSDPVTLRINGQTLVSGIDWTEGDTSSNSAISVNNAIQARSALTSIITSTWTTAGVVTFQAISTGSAYNYPVFTSSQAAFQVDGIVSTSGATATGSISGGHDAATFQIAGRILKAGYDWFAINSATDTAKSISDAISTDSVLSGLVISSWNAGAVVFTTSTAIGTAVNYTLGTSTQTALAISSPVNFLAGKSSSAALGTMMGGTDAAFSSGTSVINISTHNFTTGLGVLYSSGSGTGITPLFSGTTYFVIVVNTNSIQLAVTSTGATASPAIPITLTSISTQTTTHSFTLTPTPIGGVATLNWQVSNDTSNWTNMTQSSVTFQGPYNSTTTYWDMGTQNGRYIRARVISPTSGGMGLQIIINGKY